MGRPNYPNVRCVVITRGGNGLELIGDGAVRFRNHFVCKENINNPVNVTLGNIFLKHR